jgi:hypothetical protein
MTFIQTKNKFENLRKQIRSGNTTYEAGVKSLTEGDKNYTSNLGIFLLVVSVYNTLCKRLGFSMTN